MRLIHYKYKKEEKWGIIEGGKICVLKDDPYKRIVPSAKKVLLKHVRFLPPARPTKIVLAGLNYRDHAQELGYAIPKQPIIFLKPPSACIGHQEAIVYPSGVKRLDYEAELAVVISKEAKRVKPGRAAGHILGFSCLNDVTARDLQAKDGQWTRAKSFDTFCPMGPWLVTDHKNDDASIKLYLNGSLKQMSSTKNFIFSVPELISFISHIMTLLPGDVVSTGTPAGIGAMKRGDQVSVDIEGIGTLDNRVI